MTAAVGPSLLVCALVVGGQQVAEAQATAAEPPVRRVEAAFAVGWLGGARLGERDANLRTRDGGNSRLFGTDSSFGGTPVIEARVGYALTRRYTIEGRIGLSWPELRTEISGDTEGAPALTVAESVDQYTIEGALLVSLDRWRFGSFEPFASGGAGYLRQLHEGRTLVEQGVLYHVGGGVKREFFTRERGWVKSAAVRGDVRLNVPAGGIELDEGTRIHPAASVGFHVGF